MAFYSVLKCRVIGIEASAARLTTGIASLDGLRRSECRRPGHMMDIPGMLTHFRLHYSDFTKVRYMEQAGSCNSTHDALMPRGG